MNNRFTSTLLLSLITAFLALSSSHMSALGNTYPLKEGVNQDGINDSINTLIATKAEKNKPALTLYAIALQNSLSVKTKGEAILVNNQLVTASRCILRTTKLNITDEMGQIMVMTIDTNKKQHDYARFRSLCYDVEQSVTILTDCDSL